MEVCDLVLTLAGTFSHSCDAGSLIRGFIRVSTRSELEAGAHHRVFARNPANPRSVQPRSRAADQRTGAGPTFTASPANDAGAAPSHTHDVTQPRTTARSSLFPGPTRLHSSSSCHDLCASPRSDLPSPHVHPEHCPHTAEHCTHDQSECDWLREICSGLWDCFRDSREQYTDNLSLIFLSLVISFLPHFSAVFVFTTLAKKEPEKESRHYNAHSK